MSTGKLQETSGIKISIDDYCIDEKIPKTKIKILEKELSEPHLVYDNIALTDNYLIAMNADGSPNGAFANIKYNDLVWIYIGEGAVNPISVLSLAKGKEEQNTKLVAKIAIAEHFLKNLISISMIGVPSSGTQSIMIAFSKDRTAIVACDAKSRFFSSKPSKNFRNLIDTIASRCPNNLMIGEEYEDTFCEMMGIDTYKTSSDFGVSPYEGEGGDGGDDLL